jgi:hypothetical protein
MTTFYGIELNDRNKIGADTTGGATINVTLSKLNWVVAGTTGGGSTGGGSTGGGTTTSPPPIGWATPVTVGYAYAVGFGGAGDTTDASKSFTDSVSAPWVLTGTRIAGAEAYSTIQGVLGLNSAQVPGDRAYTSLAFTLSSSGNKQILIRLKSSAYTDGCTPSYLLTGLSETQQLFTVRLSDFKAANDLSGTGAPNYASCKDTVGTAFDLADFDKIEITDRKETTGTTNINVRLISLSWLEQSL